MKTKVFSSRLSPNTIKNLKSVSNKQNLPIQKLLEDLITSGLSQFETVSDPWAKFGKVLNKEADLTEIIQSKKTKNIKLRQKNRLEITSDV